MPSASRRAPDVQGRQGRIIHDKGDDAGFFRGGADDFHAGNFAQQMRGVGQEVLLVAGDFFQADGLEEFDGRPQGDAAGDVGGSGLELVGQDVVGGFLESNGADHVPTALIGGHGVEEPGLAVEDPDAGGAVEFVPGEDVEIGVEFADVGGCVGDPLGAVDEDGGAAGVGFFDDFLHGIDGSQGVGDVGDGNHLGAIIQEALEFIHEQFPAVVHGNDAEDGPGLLAGHLPGNDIGMMFHGREDDLVAGGEEFAAVTGGDQIDALGGAASEDDLAGFGGVDEAGDFFPRRS